MDVRCKYCHIDYEVDESVLRGASTVMECINCGLRFEVDAPDADADGDADTDAVVSAASSSSTSSTAASAAAEGRRAWRVRSPAGAVRDVPELTMLQKWIFTGLVTREWEITVDAETWKPLGNIDELQPFFGFAEEAHDAWETAATAALEVVVPAGQKQDSSVELDLSQLEEIVDDESSRRPVKAPRAPTEQGRPPPIPPALPIDVDAGGWPLVSDEDVFEVMHPEFKDAPPPRRRLPPLPPGSTLPVDESAEDGWSLIAISERLFSNQPGATPAPSPHKREIITLDLPSREIVDTSTGIPATITDEDWVVGARPEPLRKPAPPPRSNLPGVLAVVAVLAGAALVYWFGVRNRSETRHASIQPQPMARPPLGSQGPADAAPAPTASEAVATARLAIIAGDAQQLRMARTGLATYQPASAEVIALRSRTAAALAQSILDRAIIAGSGGPDSEVEALRKEAAELAALAAEAGPDPLVSLATADAARLTGDRGPALRRTLKSAQAHSPIDYALIDAMTYERDGDFRNARRSLEGIVADADASGDSRPRFRLALLLFRTKELAEARRVLASLLENQPTPLVAKELAAAIDRQAKQVAKVDPIPPTPPDPDPRPKESFETLVARAEELAEEVKCAEALALYERALAINRRSVTVLSGMGYCEIERGKMAAAHQRFRAALKISPGHIDSLLGEAETFQQEGLRADAIETYRRILARNPSEYYRKIARRQIKSLGGDPDEGAPPAPEPAPEPTPEPTPEPAPLDP